MAAPTIVWSHVSNSIMANENGVAWPGVGGGPGTRVISGGGYAHGYTAGAATETNGNSASGLIPIVGHRIEYDAQADSTRWLVGFACPPNADLHMTFHVWALIQP